METEAVVAVVLQAALIMATPTMAMDMALIMPNNPHAKKLALWYQPQNVV